MSLIEDLLLKGYLDDNLKESSNNAADYLIRIFTYCAKSDGVICANERDYIIKYIESFGMNSCEETWLFAQYDYARFSNYSKDTIVRLKDCVNKLYDKNNLCFDMLYHILSLCLLNKDILNDGESNIIEDFINEFKLDANSCDKIYERVLLEKSGEKYKTSTKVDKLDEYYKTLGLSKDATKEDLKKQYALLTKNYHPDRYNNEQIPQQVKNELEDTYKKINLAYDNLKDIL